ncbi:hypothetical protein [Aeromonas media]|uniref:hypothetical protein n=1 Tax=Aeromonas media TaxID=651 RepID=UPI003CFE5049
MGFWENAGKLTKDVAKNTLDSAMEMNEARARLEGKSSAELQRIINDSGYFSSTTDMEKRHARAILRNRGDL